MRDPNQPYIPERYPLMLYSTPTASIIVQDEAQETEARKQGYKDYTQVNVASDGLEHWSPDNLIGEATLLFQRKLLALSQPELVDALREMRREATAPPPEALADDRALDFEAMTDDGLRAFIASAGGATPHHRAGREKLLTLAQEAQAGAQNVAA